MVLYPLHEKAQEAAIMLADVHLRPTLREAVKVLSTAILWQGGSSSERELSNDGVPIYKWEGHVLYAPYQSTDPKHTPWVHWTTECYHRAWWMVSLAWFADQELQKRFYVGQSPEYQRMSKWVEQGCTRLFTKRYSATEVGNFPLISPIKAILPNLEELDTVHAYRQMYKELRDKGYFRMKWTNREIPEFLQEPKPEQKLLEFKASSVICDTCMAPFPIHGSVCGVGGCPANVNKVPF